MPVRVLDLGQRGPWMAGLTTGATSAPLPAGLGRRLGVALTRRRSVGVARVLPEPALQLLDPGDQLGDDPVPVRELAVSLGQRGLQLRHARLGRLHQPSWSAGEVAEGDNDAHTPSPPRSQDSDLDATRHADHAVTRSESAE